MYDIDKNLGGGQGALAQFGNGPIDVVIEYNTVAHINGDAVIRKADGAPMTGFRLTNNVLSGGGYYGFFLGGTPSSNRCDANTAVHFPGAVLTGNAYVAAHSTFKAGCPNNLWLNTTADLLSYDPVTGVTSGTLAPYGVRPPQ